jgi:hypothetical protein
MKRRRLALALPAALLAGCAVGPRAPEASRPRLEDKPSPGPLPQAAPVEPPADAIRIPDGFVSIGQYLPPGLNPAVADCTPYLQQALDRHDRVFIPPGVYRLGSNQTQSDGIELRDSQQVLGATGQSVIRQAPGCRIAFSVFRGAGGTNSARDNKRDITVSGLRFEGFDNPLWDRRVDQWYHCLTIHSATHVLVEDCEFVRFRGDGIYVGSGNVGGLERHNTGVTIRRCRFDGGAGRNRNAISVIDCDGLEIDDCAFVDCSSPPMPGCIDLEPNHPFNVVRNVRISGCSFDGRTGQHAILVHLLVGQPTQRVENIVVRGNRFLPRLQSRLATMAFNGAGKRWSEAGGSTVAIVDNEFLALAEAIAVRHARGMTIEGNRFVRTGAVTLGDTAKAAPSLLDARVANNRFEGSGNGNGQLVVASVRELQVVGNLFDRPRRSPAAIAFVGLGVRTRTERVLIADNRFERGPAQTAAFAFSSAETDRASFTVRDNTGDLALLPQD